MQSTTLQPSLSQCGALQDKPSNRGGRLPMGVSQGPSGYVLSTSRKSRAKLRMDLGLQVDPVATAASISIMAGFGAFLSKMSGLSSLRAQRDSAAETLRQAKVLLLAGNLDLESYERAAAAAKTLGQEYEAAKTIFSVGTTQVQIGDPTAAPNLREKAPLRPGREAAPSRNDVPQMTQSALDSRGSGRPLLRPRAKEGSEPESVSSPVGDLMFGFILAQLMALFLFSMLPDPVTESRSAFDPNCEPCVQLHAKAETNGVTPSITEKM